MVDEFEPEAVHIATEAPIGFAVRNHCLATGRPFTTAYHTQFPGVRPRPLSTAGRGHLPLAALVPRARPAVMVPTREIHRRLEVAAIH